MADQLPPPTPDYDPPVPPLAAGQLPPPPGEPPNQTDFIPAGHGPIDGPGRDPWWRRKVVKLPLAAWIAIVGALVTVGIVAVATGDDDDAIESAENSPARTESASDEGESDDSTVVDTAAAVVTTPLTEPSTTAEPAATTSTTTTTTAPAVLDTEPAGGTNPANARPVGDPVQSAFTYAPEFSDAEWTGFVQGLVETGTGQFNDTPGRCLVLVGTLTPTTAEGSVSSGFNTPSVSMIVDGRLVDTGFADCDTSGLEANGYGWILDAEVTIGTAYPFFAEFFLDADAPLPEAVVIGSATGDDAIYYQPTILESIPTP
jgi:hypothetical protein